MKIVALQTDIVWEDPEANFAHLRPQLAMAAATGARLVVLPEMFACGFTMRSERVAEPVDGPSTLFLRDEARRHALWMCGSLPERPHAAERPYNTLVLASPDGALFRYRKIHPFTYAGEHESYAAGTDFLTVDVEGLRCTFFICYDLRFADEFWVTAQATDCYVVIANWPEKRRQHWTSLLVARAIENQAYVVGANRVGHGNGLDYTGDSRIVDPWGELLATAAGRETLLVADVDPAVVSEARKRFPMLVDRRTPSA
jgi:predicted amidohydrolase